jgi:hypothetical protein
MTSSNMMIHAFIMNTELEKAWKEALVVNCKVKCKV